MSVEHEGNGELDRRGFFRQSATVAGVFALAGAGLGSSGCATQTVFNSEINGTLLDATRQFTSSRVSTESFERVPGVLVTEIAGDGGNWEVTVNGEWVDQSSDSYQVRQGDRIFWVVYN